MSRIQENLKGLLRKVLDAMDGGSTDLTEDEMSFLLEVLQSVTDEKISKYQACQLLRISRAKFDNLVMDGKLPKGRKQAGFKELFWMKADIVKYITTRK